MATMKEAKELMAELKGAQAALGAEGTGTQERVAPFISRALDLLGPEEGAHVKVQPQSNSTDTHAFELLAFITAPDHDIDSWLVITRSIHVGARLQRLLRYSGRFGDVDGVFGSDDAEARERKLLKFCRFDKSVLVVNFSLIRSGGFHMDVKHPFGVAATNSMSKGDLTQILHRFHQSTARPSTVFVSDRGV